MVLLGTYIHVCIAALYIDSTKLHYWKSSPNTTFTGRAGTDKCQRTKFVWREGEKGFTEESNKYNVIAS